MPRMTMVEAIRDAMDVIDAARRQRRRVRRGCRLFRRRVPLHRGAAAEVRHQPLLRHADQRARHRRRRRRHGGLWPAARASRSSSPTTCIRPTTRSCRRRRGCATARPASSPRRWSCACRTGGGIFGGQTHSQSPEALFTHVSGLKTVDPVQSLRRQGPADRGDRGRRSGDLPRAQAALQRPVRRPSRPAGDAVGASIRRARCRTATTPCRSARPRSVREGAAVTVLAYGTMVHRRRGGGRRDRHRRRDHRSAHAACRSTSRRSWPRSRRPAAASSCTRRR